MCVRVFEKSFRSVLLGRKWWRPFHHHHHHDTHNHAYNSPFDSVLENSHSYSRTHEPQVRASEKCARAKMPKHSQSTFILNGQYLKMALLMWFIDLMLLLMLLATPFRQCCLYDYGACTQISDFCLAIHCVWLLCLCVSAVQQLVKLYRFWFQCGKIDYVDFSLSLSLARFLSLCVSACIWILFYMHTYIPFV